MIHEHSGDLRVDLRDGGNGPMNSEALRAAWAVPLATVNDVRAQMESAFKAIVAQMLDAHAESVAIAERANKRAADIESASASRPSSSASASSFTSTPTVARWTPPTRPRCRSARPLTGPK
jgi:hypothetical protein